jgi:hypothetical protein
MLAAPQDAQPSRRIGLTRGERDRLMFQLRRWRWWRESDRKEDRWLASGVARAVDYGRAPSKVHKRSGGAPPIAVDPHEGEAWLARMDEVIAALDDHERQLVWWKAADGSETDASERVSNATLAGRLGCSERIVARLWGTVSLRLVNELWPGSSGGFAGNRRLG